MDINRVIKGGSPSYGIPAVRSSGGKSGGSFQQNLGNQLKERFKHRITTLFDEINSDAASIIEHVDMSKLENYRRLIGELLNEVVRNAYYLQTDRVLDFSGTQRIYATISVIDQKLEELTEELISRSSEQIGFLSRVDEIRGLVMDLLF